MRNIKGKQERKIIFTPMKYYSQDDEDLFFVWINKIRCVESYKEIGHELHVFLKKKRLVFSDFANLVGLFKRYRLKNPHQIADLLIDQNNDDLLRIFKKHWPSLNRKVTVHE